MLRKDNSFSKKRMTARQQMQLHQAPKRLAYQKLQKRLEVIAGYLDNMTQMLEESAAQLSPLHYPTDRLRWLIDSGFPTLKERVQKEYDEVNTRLEHEILPGAKK